jgi:putative redox protein
MPFELIRFAGHSGEQLSARIDMPDQPPKAYALFSHCFTCSKDLRPVNRIAEELNAEGIALFRFDFTGLGKSDGEFAKTHFTSNVQDLIAAADYMKNHLQAPDFVIGHSLGGTASIVAAHAIPSIRAVATIGSPSNASNVLRQFSESLDEIERSGEAKVLLAGRPFTIKKDFIDDVKAQDIEAAVASLARPFMILHSPIDETVSIDHARTLYCLAKHPKSFVSLDKADHLLLENDEDSRYIGRILAAWATQYV